MECDVLLNMNCFTLACLNHKAICLFLTGEVVIKKYIVIPFRVFSYCWSAYLKKTKQNKKNPKKTKGVGLRFFLKSSLPCPVYFNEKNNKVMIVLWSRFCKSHILVTAGRFETRIYYIQCGYLIPGSQGSISWVDSEFHTLLPYDRSS